MRFLALLALGGSIGLATAASAQVVGVVTSRTANVTGYQYGQNGNTFQYNGGVENGATQYYNSDSSGSPVYINYQIATDVSSSSISFANNITTSGYISDSSNSTTVEVTYTNPTNHAINPILHSQIIPGGFGVYFGNPAGNPTNVGGVIGDVNQTPESATSTFYNAFVHGIGLDTSINLGRAGFSFQILSGATTVAAFSGDVTVSLSQSCTFATLFTCGYFTQPHNNMVLGEALTLDTPTGMPLTNFGLIAADSAERAVGYSWDATDVVIPLGFLAPGASTTLTYVTTVSASIFTPIQANGDMIVAYSGFGDPIGKQAGGGGIPDPKFPLLDLGLPNLDPATGDLTAAGFQGYNPTPLPLGHGLTPSAVPEPAAWAMMLIGSGLVGGALRRRRREIRTV